MAIPDLSYSRVSHLENRKKLEASGDLTAPILVVNDYPSSVDMNDGGFFLGTERTQFNMTLASAELDRLDLRITSLFQQNLQAKEIRQVQLEGYYSPSIQEQLPNLLEEFQKWQGSFIVAYGEFNLLAFSKGAFSGIDKYQGSIYSLKELGWHFEGSDKKWVMFMYHPRTHRLSDSPMTIYASYGNWQKLQKFRDLDKRKFPPRAEIKVLKTVREVYQGLDLILKETGPTAVDIETTGDTVSCIGFSLSSEEAFVIPFLGEKGNFWSLKQEVKVIQKMAEVLENPNKRKIFQNGYFDMRRLYRELGIQTRGLWYDTMLAAHAYWTDLPKGLDALTNTYTFHRYYKDDGKMWKIKRKDMDFEKGWRYNGMDCITTHCVFLGQLKEIRRDGTNLEFLRESMLAHKPLIEMALTGLPVDLIQKDSVLREAKKRLLWLEASINAEVPEELRPFNPKSSKAIMAFLYQHLGLKERVNRKTKKPTCDTKTLQTIKHQGKKGSLFADLLLEHRSLQKIVSSYYQAPLFEGRLINDYKISGTKSGRLSSSKTIEGFGTNMQNQPPEMKKFLIAPDGHILIEIDLSTAENWVVAFTAEDEIMMEILTSGKDVHTANAARMFGVSEEDVTKDMRQKGKRANHAANYCMGPHTFAFQADLPISVTTKLLQDYFKVFFKVKQLQEKVEEQVRKTRTVTNLFGWRKKFLGPITDTVVRSAVSFNPQSTIGRYMVRGLNSLVEDSRLEGIQLNATVHDSLVASIPVSRGFEGVWEVIDVIKEHLTIKLTVHGRSFSVPCDAKVGLSWGSMIEIKPLTKEVAEEKWRELLNLIAEGKKYGQSHASWETGLRAIWSSLTTQSAQGVTMSGVG